MSVSETVLLDTPTLTVLHEPRIQLLRVIWRGQHDSESVRNSCEQVLKHICNTRCALMLNDSSEAYGNWWKASEWIGQVFAAQLGKHGIRTVAWINAMDWPSRHSVASTLPHIQDIEVQIFDFDEQEAAYAWLLTKVPAA